MKEKKKSPLPAAARMAQALEIPQKALFSGPHVEIAGGSEVVVEGSRGVLEYTQESIRLAAGEMVVRIVGSNLTIRSMQAGNVVAAGQITAVEYIR